MIAVVQLRGRWGRPPDIGLHERVSNHSERLRPKAVVVNVGGQLAA